MTELVGGRHQNRAADARLHILFRRILGQPLEQFLEACLQCLKHFLNRHNLVPDTEGFRQVVRVVDAALR